MKLFFNYTLFLILLFSGSKFISQNADSILTLLKKDKEDTNKVKHLNALGWIVMYQNPDSAISMGNQALTISNKLSDKKAIANSNSNLGVYFWITGEYPKSLSYQFKSLELREKIGDKNGIATSLGNIGIVFWNQKNYDKALEYLLKALKLAEEMGNKGGMAKNLGNIGVLYFQQLKYNEAIDYYKKALIIDEELGEKNRIATWLGNIGTTFHEQSKTSKDLNKQDSLAKQALVYYAKALKMEEELGNNTKIARHLGNIGALYAKLKKYPEAEENILKALELSKNSGILSERMIFENALSEIYMATGNYKKAFDYYKLHAIDKDSLYNQEKDNEITRNEMNYEFSKKEALTKAEQDKKDAVNAAESKQQKFILLLVCGVLVLVFIFSAFIFRSLRVTKKQKQLIEIKNKETEEQKHIIEEKNKDILDSIRYAKRIQTSLLPTEKYIERNLKN